MYAQLLQALHKQLTYLIKCIYIWTKKYVQIACLQRLRNLNTQRTMALLIIVFLWLPNEQNVWPHKNVHMWVYMFGD